MPSLSSDQLSNAQNAASALLSAGMSTAFLPLALAQLAFETGGFSSRVETADNNLSGIKYIGRPDVQLNASQGSISPEGNYYAHFDSVADWARDYMRLLSSGSNPPIDATDTTDLAERLKDNGYYTDTVYNYAAGLAAWLPAVQGVSDDARSVVVIRRSLTLAALVLLAFAIFYYYKYVRK